MDCRVVEFPDVGMTCRQTLNSLWALYMEVLSGQRARVRFGTRWSEYHSGNSDLLRDAYQAIYAQCDDTHGLPNLAKGHQMRRGPPGVVVNSGTFDSRRQFARGPYGGLF